MNDPAKCHPFLDALREQDRQRLLAAARPFQAAPGDFLTREGEPADAFYLIESGEVGISTHLAKRGTVPIQTLGPGDVVGWSWLVQPFVWQFDARAQAAVQGLCIDAAWLRAECDRDHELGYQVLKRMLAVVGSRLAAARIHQLDIYR